MELNYSTQRLLALRKLTRAVADLLRGRMKVYLSTLAPLLHPKIVLGNYVEGGSYELSRTGDKPFKELQGFYETIAQSKLYRLPSELKIPLEVINSKLEMTPVEQEHVATSGNESKTITITSPLKWVLTYAGFAPSKFKESLEKEHRDGDEILQFVLHYLMMHTVVSNQPGVRDILEALHFPLSTQNFADFGGLPITCISSSISTIRPPDEVIIESTEVSGMNVFEEVVNIEDVARLRDPLKDQLQVLVNDYVEE
ncbi:MAG TPA: hypothetical protein VF074_09080 [Pyrinomonadaceae bacterium]